MAVEEQTQYNTSYQVRSGGALRWGQRLTMSNRRITKLGFWIHKDGIPGTGNVTFSIRRVSDDGVILSKVWGIANDLPVSAALREVEFDAPKTINEEVRICLEHSGGSADNCVMSNYENSDVKASEYTCKYINSSWTDYETMDMAYRYTWVEPPSGRGWAQK